MNFQIEFNNISVGLIEDKGYWVSRGVNISWRVRSEAKMMGEAKKEIIYDLEHEPKRVDLGKG